MKWTKSYFIQRAQLSPELVGCVFAREDIWRAGIYLEGSELLCNLGLHKSEAEAKTAVAQWIGKTMAQFSNALAEGQPRVDEE